ncbi:toxin [Streptomyces sp. AcH 505]|uniref:DUF397 domain-containing protein n=1 Tax=Streptomyces sp. AcH 505 TaxID=352211 RepID=UPI0005923E29|nr:toxin [Streptomyces sp. AcH 505]
MSTVELDWFKSSYSGTEGDNCVEIATTPDTVHIRDSKNRLTVRLTVSPSTWSAFATYVREAR